MSALPASYTATALRSAGGMGSGTPASCRGRRGKEEGEGLNQKEEEGGGKRIRRGTGKTSRAGAGQGIGKEEGMK